MCLGVHGGVVLGLCYVFPFGASRVGDGRGGNLGSYAEGLVGGGLVGGASRRSDFGWSRFFCVGPIFALLGISRMGLAFLP